MNERRYAFCIEMANLSRELKDYEAAQRWYAEAWAELNKEDKMDVKFHPIKDLRIDNHE